MDVPYARTTSANVKWPGVAGLTAGDREFTDSSLEGTGFEPSVPDRNRRPAHPESGAFLSGPAEPEGASNQRACDRTLIRSSRGAHRALTTRGTEWSEMDLDDLANVWRSSSLGQFLPSFASSFFSRLATPVAPRSRA